jgi:hypothetical protein
MITLETENQTRVEGLSREKRYAKYLRNEPASRKPRPRKERKARRLTRCAKRDLRSRQVTWGTHLVEMRKECDLRSRQRRKPVR